MQSLQLTAAGLLAGLSGPLSAHAGLDESSATLLALHAVAHSINEHPAVLILLTGGVLALGAALLSTYGLYRSTQSKRR